ncbi:hypothetical protein BH24ACT5_BH24ACT5_01410 [soil metagenome]
MATQLATERGLQLAVESPHRGTLAEHPSQTATLLDRADPDVGVDLDTAHIFNSGCPVNAVLTLLGHRLSHVAIRDCKPDGTSCVPGDGAFDFQGLVVGLRQLEYSGDLVIELETPGTDDPNEIMKDAQRTERLLAALLDEHWDESTEDT